MTQYITYTTSSIITFMPRKPIKVFFPALSAGSLVSVGYSTVRLGAEEDGSTTVAIGIVAELVSTVELIVSVEFE